MFTLIFVEPGSDLADHVGKVLTEQVRWDVGDFVGRSGTRFGVVLQGARPAQANSFLGRVRESLKRSGITDPVLELTVLNSATDATEISDRIKALAG